MVKWETVRKRYGKRMQAAMKVLYLDLKENLPESNPSEPWEMDADDYWVVITFRPEGKEPFDITFRIDDSHEYEGIDGGYTFSVHLVEEGGLILGQLTPYNYTPQVWVKTLPEIEKRYKLVEEGLDGITAFVADDVLPKLTVK